MKWTTIALTLGLAHLPAAALTAQQPSDDPLAKLLFPPELVMQHQAEIGLKPEQRTTITRGIAEMQAKAIDLQWRMQDATTALATLLSKPVVDQTAALAQVDSVLSLEREVKRVQLTLLIRIKNTLTPEQQSRLAEFPRR
ncbi:MAG: Spy/CpxP family protein refolding chaperone [Gemmatimonadales bacterium]